MKEIIQMELREIRVRLFAQKKRLSQLLKLEESMNRYFVNEQDSENIKARFSTFINREIEQSAARLVTLYDLLKSAEANKEEDIPESCLPF